MATATMSGADGHRMEQKKFEYFSSINSMARKIMEEREKIKQRHGSAWEKMTPNEQDTAIDNGMMDPHIRARYAMHRVDREEVICYPKLLIQTGQKIVHFGEEDLTWQDEHSAPFSWETKSQLEFSLSGPSSEQPASSSSSSQSDPKPIKPPQISQPPKGAPSCKLPSGEAPGLGSKQEEESSFWKISAERSRMDGEKSDFLSLTPSQIKSLEKGEKPLPSYLRPETPTSSFLRPETPTSSFLRPETPTSSFLRPETPSSSFLRPETPSSSFLRPETPTSSFLRPETPSSSFLRPETPSSSYLRQETPSPSPSPAPKEPDDPPAPPRAAKQRAPRPPAPPPPVPIAVTPAAISVTPRPPPLSVSAGAAGWERSQSTLPSVSNAPDDVFTAAPPRSPARSGGGARENAKSESPPLAASPTFAQFNTSSNILKTGFDFLDNW